MTILKLQSAKKNEKGIALLFTLVMLSLLLILALSFALDSMFSQKAAYNSASVSSAAFLDQAQLNQVLLLIKNGEANLDGGRLYSKDITYNTASPVTDKDMLVECLPVTGVLESTDGVLDPDSNPSTDNPKVNWNYVKDADGKIIGRTAFVVIPEDKIPLDSLLDKNLDESLAEEKHLGKDVSEITTWATIPAVFAKHGPVDTAAIIFALNWTDKGGEYKGIWASYDDLFSTLNNTLSFSLADEDKAEFKDKLSLVVSKDKEAFWVDLNGDTKVDSNEMFKRFDLTRTDWSDPKTNAEDLAFLKDKLLLTQTDSDDAPPIGDPTANPPTGLIETWEDDTVNPPCLPWLACFGYENDAKVSASGDTDYNELIGTYSSVYARRCQIAANLKDYCDDDKDSSNNSLHRPTSDVDPANWKNGTTGGIPTFTGNEKTPYIDKIGIAVTAEVKQEVTTAPKYNLWANIDIVPYVGLIYMYGQSWPGDLQVRVEMDVNLIADAAGTSVTIPTKNVVLTIDVGSGSWGTSNGYTYFAYATGSTTESTFSTDKTEVADGSQTMTVKVKDINVKSVTLYTNDADQSGYDYVKDLNFSTETQVVSAISGAKETLWCGWAAHDPRQNLNGTNIPPGGDANDADWKILTPNVSSDPRTVFSLSFTFPNKYPCLPNSQNSVVANRTEAPTVGPDKEQKDDPANEQLSTAHIKNAPMDSPWELGFIHRGARWETINLKAYDKDRTFQVYTVGANNYIMGGSTYAKGDANILDQIKMTPDSQGLQKIDISTQNEDILKALLTMIKYKCGVDSNVSENSLASGSPGVQLDTVSDIPAIASSIKTYYADSTNPTERFTRASAVNKLLLSTTSTPAIGSSDITDAIQEELIGKVVNLVKVNGKFSGDFSVIVLSQTIKDIGADSPDVIDVTRTSADGSATHAVSCQLGRFDLVGPDGSSTLNSDWKKNLYGDEITGEQKILVTGNMSVDGIITIKSFQYIE